MRVLGAIKTEFGKFGETLSKVKHQIDLASRTIDKTGVRTRAIERKLREVETLPEPEALEIFALPAADQEEGEDLALEESPAETI